MIIHFSNSLPEQIFGIVKKNLGQIIFFAIWGATIFTIHHFLGIKEVAVPLAAISIIGAGLAFFLAFRNNSAYDRWWEARKIWGGIVNISRTFAGYVSNFPKDISQEDKERIIRRHLAWMNALRIQLREQNKWDEVYHWLDNDEAITYKDKVNKATQINHKQIGEITALKREGQLDIFEHQMLADCVRQMFELQGKAERIKKTTFPFFYTYFTRMFLWVFILLLPLGLVPVMGWESLPITIVTSFIFFILERTGTATMVPLDRNTSGTPMSGLCRVIEIDILQQVGANNIPEPYQTKTTKNGSVFLD
jgi:putative membrane protein